MNVRLALCAISTLINGALLTAIFLPSAKSPPPGSNECIVDTMVQVKSVSSDAVSGDIPAPTQAFNWSQIVSNDWKIYRANLRGIGCPETTTREIMRAVINENFAAQRQLILKEFEEHYWELAISGQENDRRALEQTKWGSSLARLTKERQQALGDVLGLDTGCAQMADSLSREDLEQRRSWMAPEKRVQLAGFEAGYQQELALWSESLKDQPPSEEQQAQLQKIEGEFAAAKRHLFSSNELAELRLRESDAADWAANLPGVSLTEEEWHVVAATRLNFEKSQQDLAENLALNQAEREEQQNKLQADLDATVKAALGDEQFLMIQLANNSEYQVLQNVVQRYGLPSTVTAESLQIEQNAMQAANQLYDDAALSSDVRQSGLDSVRQETESALSQIMGADGLSTYKSYGGGWLDALNRREQ